MNTTIEHLLHCTIIGIIAYLVMVYLLKQSSTVALDRTILLVAFASAYMILFGHSFPPGKINPNIF